MRVLIDTNILLDVLSNRPEFVDMSSKVWKLCETHRVQGFISALSIANIVYILRKELSAKKTKEVIEDLFLIFNVADLSSQDIKNAVASDYSDFEDALQIACANRILADYIITRDSKGFSKSNIIAISPDVFVRGVISKEVKLGYLHEE